MRMELPRAPVEFADEAELFARQSGRHATMRFVPIGHGVGCWMVRLTLHPNDPVLGLHQRGEVAEEPMEDVWLHRPLDPGERPLLPWYGFIPLRLEDLGVSGLREFLEKGNTWSGRGKFRSLEDAVRQAREQDAKAREKQRNDARENAGARARDTRRSRLKIPFVSVAIDLRSRIFHRRERNTNA